MNLPRSLPKDVAAKYGANVHSLAEGTKHAHVLVEVAQLIKLFQRPCRACYSRQLVPGKNHITVRMLIAAQDSHEF